MIVVKVMATAGSAGVRMKVQLNSKIVRAGIEFGIKFNLRYHVAQYMVPVNFMLKLTGVPKINIGCLFFTTYAPGKWAKVGVVGHW